ncbi:MAG: WG repeat-containing protein [Bacteroidetes bacterium]|nr:WG repeat-containing protein [Bacteroidota bacterium]
MMNRHPYRTKLTITLALVLSAAFAIAGDIDKAFKALNTGDYANARKYLMEVLADEPGSAPGFYGLAKYYYSKDNKAYNLDSANMFIKEAMHKLPMNPEDKANKKAIALGVRDYTIQTLHKDINNEAYGIAEKANTVESYQFYIDNYTEEGLLNRATEMRNQLAFIRARGANTYQAMDEFIKKYPDAEQQQEAKGLYEKLLYETTTADGTYQSYRKYTSTYPLGKFVKEANQRWEEEILKAYNKEHKLDSYLQFEKDYTFHPQLKQVQDSIYALVTADGTVDAFAVFVKAYSKNPNIDKAWEELYTLYTAEATPEQYASFKAKFPKYPNIKRIDAEAELATKELKPFQQADKWGYAHLGGKDSLVISISGEYEEAYGFSNGLAAVRKEECGDRCKYYYINKANQRAIQREFNYAGNFHAGYAIVGIGNCEEEDSCMYGIIDKRGEFVVPPVYDIIEDATEGFYMAAQNGKYGFINARGETAITFKYSDALPFSQGVAAVAIDDSWFFIDNEGKQLFINRFNDVSSFSDSLAAVTQDGDNWGYIDMAGNFTIQPVYEIAEDFEGGFAIVSKREKDPKNKSLMLSQRYKIDKTGKQLEKLTAPKAAPQKTTKKKRR